MPYKMPTAVRQSFEARRWVVRQSDYYFDGRGGTAHPHLHMKIEARGTVRDGVADQQLPGDIRGAVKMLAWSDGQQHQGGGGRSLIRVGGMDFVQANVPFNEANQAFMAADVSLYPHHFHALMAGNESNQDLKEEMGWIWTYFRGR